MAMSRYVAVIPAMNILVKPSVQPLIIHMVIGMTHGVLDLGKINGSINYRVGFEIPSLNYRVGGIEKSKQK